MKNKLEKLAKRLNSDLPTSEQWFWSLYSRRGFSSINDRANIVWGQFIYDVKNDFDKYVIEIQDPTHRFPHKRRRDKQKKQFAQARGYFYLSIKAFKTSQFTKGMNELKLYCEGISLEDLDPDSKSPPTPHDLGSKKGF